MTFAFMIDPPEYVRVNQVLFRRTRFGKVSRYLPIALLVLTFALSALIEMPRTVFVPALFGIGTWLLWDALTPWFQRWQIRRALSGIPSLQEPQVYTFDDAGLEMRNSLASATIAWAAITKAVETDEYFLLYFSDKGAYYLPKRVVGDECGQLRALLAGHLDSQQLALLHQ
jgi:hypothetical protein